MSLTQKLTVSDELSEKSIAFVFGYAQYCSENTTPSIKLQPVSKDKRRAR